MSMKINYNLQSTLIKRTLSNDIASLNKVMEQLSSGIRLDSPKDDAVSFKMSKNLQLAIHNDEFINNNLEISVSFMAVAESGLNSVNENLERIRALCLQGASTLYNDKQRSVITTEISQRLEEIDRLAEAVSFRDISLLNGSCSDLKFHIGIQADIFENTLDVGSAFINVHTSALGLDTTPFDASQPASAEDFRAFIEKIDKATSLIKTSISKMGIYENSMNSRRELLNDFIEVNSSYNSFLTDTDVAYAASETAKYQIKQNISVALFQQANQIPAGAMQLLR